MEYIEKRGDIYYAMSGEAKIDNINIFNSRRNIIGVNGSRVRFIINDFEIEWHTNFGYGRFDFSYVSVKYKSLVIRKYHNIDTTVRFVNLLNKYVSIQDDEKSVIIVELANNIAHCSNEIQNTQTNFTSMPIKELEQTGMLQVYSEIIALKNTIRELEEEKEELKLKLSEIDRKI